MDLSAVVNSFGPCTREDLTRAVLPSLNQELRMILQSRQVMCTEACSRNRVQQTLECQLVVEIH